VAFSLVGLVLGSGVHAAEDVTNLITEGKVDIGLRYRYESVDQDNTLKNANANTLRTRIALHSGEWYGLSGLLEVDNVSRIGGDNYNDTRNNNARYSTVADPDGTEINQLYLRYQQAFGSLTYGRQKIDLDNQRFVGSVAWRHNEQTLDGTVLRITPSKDLTFTYGYIDNVNTPFGPDGDHGYPTNPGNIKGHSHLLNASWQVAPALTISAYSYLLGLDSLSVAPTALPGTQSSRTVGVRINGLLGNLGYTGEYARQRAYADNPNHLHGDYYLAELFYQRSGYMGKVGYEVLSGDNGTVNRAFQTPLASKHLFQGWADVFLITPTAGIRDAYIGGSLPIAGGSFQTWYHSFHSDAGSENYGSEWDLSYARPIPYVKNLSVLIKYAAYDAKDYSVDTDKFWLQAQYQF
jgi:hypothetical protein